MLGFRVPVLFIRMPDTEIETGKWDNIDWSTHIVLQSNDTKPVEYAVHREAAKMSGTLCPLNINTVAPLVELCYLIRVDESVHAGSNGSLCIALTSIHIVHPTGLIKDMLEDQEHAEQTMIPLPNVSGKTMKYVIQYMEYHWCNKAEPIEKPLKVLAESC